MDQNTTALERAFELAKSGSCASVDDIKRQLHAEGYSTAQIIGGALSRQLNALIKAGKKKEHKL
jgi:hypothetical protein